MSNVDIELFISEKERLQKLYKEQLNEGKFINPREDILVFSGYADGILHFNSTRVIRLDPTDPFARSKAEILARHQVYELVEFLKKIQTRLITARL